MIEREKVIKRLEEISDYFFNVYHRSKDREEINKAKDRCDAVEDAIALLKEQEPMMVRLTTSTIRCPKCGKQITSRGAIHREIKFCWKCGQAVKWE